MVVLQTAAFLSIMGFIAWILGMVLDLPGIATLGALLVVGVGAMMTTGGLQYQDGEVRTNTSQNETVVDYQYATVDPPTNFPLGGVVMILGGVLVLQALNRGSILGGRV